MDGAISFHTAPGRRDRTRLHDSQSPSQVACGRDREWAGCGGNGLPGLAGGGLRAFSASRDFVRCCAVSLCFKSHRPDFRAGVYCAWALRRRICRSIATDIGSHRYNISASLRSMDSPWVSFTASTFMGVGVDCGRIRCENVALLPWRDGNIGCPPLALVCTFHSGEVWRTTGHLSATPQHIPGTCPAALILDRWRTEWGAVIWSRGSVTCAWAAVGMGRSWVLHRALFTEIEDDVGGI